ncbi:MAG: hypothetical protein R3E10_11640 [Gemmatimonadota bacterium]
MDTPSPAHRHRRGRATGRAWLLPLLLLGACSPDDLLTAPDAAREDGPVALAAAALPTDPAYLAPIDLGVLPGFHQSEATAVSDWGVVLVVNSRVDVTFHESAYSVGGGPQISIGHLPGASTGTYALDINGAGVIVGVSADRAFRKVPGQAIEALSGVGTPSRAAAINATGVIAGYTRFGSVEVPWRWTPGSGVQWMGVPSGATSLNVTDINDAGVVLGNAGTRTYLWNAAGTPSLLGTQSGLTKTIGWALSSSRVAVGYGLRPDGTKEALVWSPRLGTPIGLGLGYTASAHDVNASGRIAGARWDGPRSRVGLRAWTRLGGTTLDLPAPGPAGDQWTASALNSCGWIAGGHYPMGGDPLQGQGSHAVLWKRPACG